MISVKKYIFGALSVVAMASCTNDDLGLDSKGQGVAEFKVDISTPEPRTRAVTQVYDFPVIIYDTNDKVVQSYNSVSEIPQRVVMEVGDYKVESHTPGVIAKTMDKPFYKGIENIQIAQNVTTQVNVVCKMQNSKISINLDDMFLSVFDTWSITITDGESTAYEFTNESTNHSVYLYFGEAGIPQLTVNFIGVTNDGQTIKSEYILTKRQANEGYDDDNTNFGGGDAITINISTTDATDGTLGGIVINANLSFTETNENINIDITDKPITDDPGTGDPGTGDPGTGGDDANIILSLPASMTIVGDTDPSLGDTRIATESGIKSLMVRINSTSKDMMSSLKDMGTQYGIDFVSGTEVVDNQNLADFFTNVLGQNLPVPSEGATEYTFPIGNFFFLLAALPGEHTFHLSVTDMNGGVKSGETTLTVEEQ